MSKELIEYTKNGNLKGVQEFIKSGADINFEDNNCKTVFMLASRVVYKDVTKIY